MRTRTKVFIALGAWFGLTIIVFAIFGSSGKNEEFQPQEEFKLQPWVNLKLGGLDMSINRAVLYLFIAAALTTIALTYIAKRMQDKPNRVQAAVEMAYDTVLRRTIVGQNMDRQMATKWFAFVATIFFFIWFSNMIGYLPLPTNTHEKINVFGFEVPSLAIYAATANLSIPLVLTLVVWLAYHIEGVRAKGFGGFMRSYV
ncbi:MAG: F0F1 ATP synthase subunit A, partial [Actinomycetota bacterium]|nr:F0F1 ATP synthase subunit A [Actinomycetota bacterium]